MGGLVDFEDPPYQSSLELVDVTAPQWKAAHPNGARARNIRGGYFRTSYPETAGTASSLTDRALVLKRVVADYNASGNPGQFSVRESAGRFAIVGSSVKNESGAQLSTAPILDTPVTVPGGSMKASDAVAAILSAVQARTGVKVGVSSEPANIMARTVVTLSGTEQPARVALNEVFSQTKGHMYWRMLYDADWQAYFFNVTVARRVEYDTFGRRHVALVR